MSTDCFGAHDTELVDEIDQLLAYEESELDTLNVCPVGSATPQRVEIQPSEFTEFAIKVPTNEAIVPFSFNERRYLRSIYDTPAKRVLLKAARQVEKCLLASDRVVTPDGRWITIEDLRIGDRVVSLHALDPDAEECAVPHGEIRPFRTNNRFEQDIVVDKRSVGKKRAVRLRTKMGCVLHLSEDTPVLGGRGWCSAAGMGRGEPVATIRSLGDAAVFGEGYGKSLEFSSTIPDGLFLEATSSELVAFIKSLWRRSGSVYGRGGKLRCALYLPSRLTAERARWLLLKIGIPAHCRRGEGDAHSVSVGGKAAQAFLDMIVTGVPPEPKSSDVLWDTVVDVEPLGQEEVYHLETAKNHNYVHEGAVVHNSTFIGNKMITYCAVVPNFKTLYVSATQQQAQVFSSDRIKDPIDLSPELAYLLDSKLSQNVLFKQFRNRSQIRIRYTYHSADRTRGISADLVTIDELQDIIYHHIPIIEQCASHSQWKLFCDAGTPKSLDNTIEVLWAQFSTQNEWVVPCGRHGLPKQPGTWHWNVLGMKNIGKKGLICAKCGQPIDPTHPLATWASMQPRTVNNANRVTMDGYRISQLMVPWIDWEGDILMNLDRYDLPQINNEMLGLSSDSGIRPLTQRSVRVCCQPDIHLGDFELNASRCVDGVFAGIDWGCHDNQTRILTDSGFKYFRDLTDDDLVAQFDKDTRQMSFVRPLTRTVRDWNGPLYHITGRDVDMMLTGTHRMLVQPARQKDWCVESMEELADRQEGGNMRGWVDWEGEELTTFTVPGIPPCLGDEGCEPAQMGGDFWITRLGTLLSSGLPARGVYGRQLQRWWIDNVGPTKDTERIPRRFLNLSKRQLRILFSAMMAGKGGVLGGYMSASKGLCEDFQEVCLRLGYTATVEMHMSSNSDGKVHYKTSWSQKRDFRLSREQIKKIPYRGQVYCCAVPSGLIVTERNGRIAYQGNTGERESYTVLTLGGYMGKGFQVFYVHRFVGEDLEPSRQLDRIAQICVLVGVKLIGADYGGGYDRNDWIMRNFGIHKLAKYQYAGNPKSKVKWEPRLGRFILHRSEVMKDIFSAIKRRQIGLPCWEEFSSPYAMDMCNIFAEFSKQLRMTQYMVSPGKSDDTFHSILYCFFASMLVRPRPDILIPRSANDVNFHRHN